MKRLPGMCAGEASTDEKMSKNSEKQCKTVILAPKRPLQLSKFKFLIQNLNFKPLLALLISNITYMKRLRSMGAGEASTDEKTVQNSAKQCKTVQNSDFGAKTTVTAQNSNFLIQNLNFKPLFALRISKITYMKRLRSMGAEQASTDEEMSKNR